MTKTIKRTLFLLAAMICSIIGGGNCVYAQGNPHAIVGVADEAISAMSVIPKTESDAASRYFVVRVLKRVPSTDQLTKPDVFTTIGYLHVNSSDQLVVHEEENIHMNISDNYDHAWHIHALDGADYGEHSHLFFKNAKTGKFISNSTTSVTHDETLINVNETSAGTNYFRMVPYADHMQERVTVTHDEYEAYSGTKGTHKNADGGTEFYIIKNVDLFDYKRHFVYLNGSKYKMHCKGTSGSYSIVIVDSEQPGFNDYGADGVKDDIVFEIIEAEVAEANVSVTYKFNVKEGTKDLWHFYIQTNSTSETALTTADAIKTHFPNRLKYYKNLTNVTETKENGFDIVSVDCEQAFPFRISEELHSFDDANKDNRLYFYTMSAGAPNDKTDGYYVGLENANSSDHEKMKKHGHYNGSGTNDSDFSPYYESLMTDFHRHIDGSLYWYFCKAKDEIDNPNALRVYLFTTTTHPLIANDEIHNSYTSGLAYYGISFLRDGVDPEHMHANEPCGHDVFEIVPNEISGTMPNGFSLQLMSDPTLKLATTFDGTNYTDASGNPDKSFFKIARGATSLQTRLNVNSATDLINLSVNSRGTRNVGGIDKDAYESWFKDLMTQYRIARLWPGGVEVDDGPLPADYKVLRDELESWLPGYVDYQRLYNLAAILESYPDYTTFDINKKYRIELYKEGNSGDNKMLSSFEAYMQEDKAGIAYTGMQNSKNQSSILSNIRKVDTGDTDWYGNPIYEEIWGAPDATTYWQICPTDDKTPESGEEIQVAIYNCNVGAFLTKTDTGVSFGTPVAFSESAAQSADKFYVKQEDTSDQWVILSSLSTDDEVKKLHVGSSGALEWVSGYNHDVKIKDYNYATAGENGGRWMFSQIDEYTMNLNPHDGAYWSTLCLPFPVTLPDGVTAYTAGATSDKEKSDPANSIAKIALSSVTGTLPANTPAIIKAGSATINLTVGDGSSISGSSGGFTGVNAQWGQEDVNIIKKLSYFGLSKVGNDFGFFVITSRDGHTYTQLPANKAYIKMTADLKEKLAETGIKDDDESGAKRAFVMFHFLDDNEITAVDTVTGEWTTYPADGIYYDLSGRRVENPQRGIYVTSKGKKIVVK